MKIFRIIGSLLVILWGFGQILRYLIQYGLTLPVSSYQYGAFTACSIGLIFFIAGIFELKKHWLAWNLSREKDS